MTNSKSTKKALLTSTLAVLMCVAMLIGTTFAWFTDSASTAVNKIQAGTLDIALEKLVNDEWVNAEGSTLDFIKAADVPESEAVLWEPGCTYSLSDIRIVNNGNLALKYKIAITGINGDAKLNEAIEWTINGVSLDEEATLLPGESSATLSITGHMKEEAGNEYQGLSIDGAAITVVATQYTYEYDSNDNQYDANATIPIINVSVPAIAEEIEAAIAEAAESGTDKLTLNILPEAAETTVTLNATTLQKIDNLVINLGENVVLDVKDHSRGENDIRDRFFVQDGQSLTITGKGTIGSSDYFGACGGGTLILENEGGFIQNGLNNSMINVAPHGATVIIRNYSMSNTYTAVHPLITVGDGITSDNGKTEASSITLENVTMSNYYFDDTVSPSVKRAGGIGIQVWKGDVDVTTTNVTFNGNTSLNVVKSPRGYADSAFLTLATDNSASATLNGTIQ